jgi:hypothetical protein
LVEVRQIELCFGEDLRLRLPRFMNWGLHVPAMEYEAVFLDGGFSPDEGSIINIVFLNPAEVRFVGGQSGFAD